MGNSEWFNRRAIRLHLTLIVVFPGCLALGWWQLNVALSGNTLSWVYTFEWPGFAVYAVYMWWRLLHDATEQMDESTLMPGAVGKIKRSSKVRNGEKPTCLQPCEAVSISPSTRLVT